MLLTTELDNGITYSQPPILIRVNRFNEKSSQKFSEDMTKAHESKQPIIPIIIDSYGGSPYSLLAIITEIQNSKKPIITICESKAMSAGAILFGFGSMRFMSPNATLMLHELSTLPASKLEDLKADVEETNRLNNHLFTMLAQHCNLKDQYFIDLIHQKGHADWYLNAKEAKKHKLCTHIKIPTLNVKVSVNFELEY